VEQPPPEVFAGEGASSATCVNHFGFGERIGFPRVPVMAARLLLKPANRLFSFSTHTDPHLRQVHFKWGVGLSREKISTNQCPQFLHSIFMMADLQSAGMNIQVGALAYFPINFCARKEQPSNRACSAAKCELNKFRKKETETIYTRYFDLVASNCSLRFSWKG
jgi:hypothetical protein